MTKDNKQELWHTWRGAADERGGWIVPVDNPGYVLGAINSKATRQAVGDKLESHEKAIIRIDAVNANQEETITKMLVQSATDIAIIKTELKNINKKLE